MSETKPGRLSRRDWMGTVSRPALAASLGSVLAAEVARGDERAEPAAAADRGARVYNVREFGAKGDGATLDTAAVQAAIDAANKDDGGVVLVPAGDFVVGTLDLKSYVTLRLAAKGRLLGSGDAAHYKAGKGIPSGNGNIVLLSAADAQGIGIEGPGTIDGNGAKFYTGEGDKTGPCQDSSEGYFERPHLLVFYKCQDVRVRDVFLTNSAYHGVRILQCQRVKFDGVRIHNRVNKNNDGFHFNSCEYVHVTNCDVACQDDACALFGSNKFVTVTNSTFSTRWSVFRFGGGQPENITVSNCVIYETYGCPIKIHVPPRGRRRGRPEPLPNRMENVMFSNIVMKKVTGPISIGLGSAADLCGTTPPPRPDALPSLPGIIRGLRFEGIRASVVANPVHDYLPWESKAWDDERGTEKWSAIVVNSSDDGPIEEITFSDVHVTYEGGGTAEHARREIPKVAGEYFEIGTPPAYGLYARNVRGLTLENVRFETTTPDLRPAIVFDRVQDASIHRLSAQANDKAESLLRFTDSKDVLLTASRVLTPAAVFLRVEGPANENIRVDGGDLVKAKQAVSLAEGTPTTAVTVRV